MDPMTTKPLVILPCYNEAPRLAAVIQGVRAVLPQALVAVVDDASHDASAAVARAAGAIVLTHGCNLGYGGALETGYLFALHRGLAPVLQLDADGQHPPACLPDLLQAVTREGVDVAIGSRYLATTSDPTPFIRRAGQRFFAGIIRLLTGLRLTDPTSGFQGLSRRAVELFASGVFPCDYPDSDVIVMASLAGLTIRELPVPMKARVGGKSMHAGLKPLYYGIKMLLALFVVLLNRRLWRRWRQPERRHQVSGVRFQEGKSDS